MTLKTFYPRILLTILILFTLYLCFYNLGKAPLENWDEAWYGEMTKQMLRTREFIVPFWNYHPFFDKAPLYMWLSALFSLPFGISETTIRLTSAISGLASILLVSIYSYKKFGVIPAFLAFSTLAFNNVYIWRVRSGNLDALVTLLILLSFFLMISKYKKRYLLLGIVFACTYLTKTSLVVFPFAIFVLHEILFQRKNIAKNFKEYLKMIGIVVILAGSWLLSGFIKVGIEFPVRYLLNSDQGVLSGAGKFNKDYIGYAYYSLQRRFSWLVILGGLFLLKDLKKPQNLTLLLFGSLLLIQLSFIDRSNNWYILPALPFWSVAAAYGVYSLLRLLRNNIIASLLVLLVSSYISFKTLTVNILPILSSETTAKQAESSREIGRLSQPTDTIIRLDHLYPTTIYYADRRVLSSPADANTNFDFISREDLDKKISQRQIRWFIGTGTDIENFAQQLPLKTRTYPVNSEESILEVLN